MYDKNSIAYVSNKKMLSFIAPMIEDIKKNFANFYRENIGEIDKEKLPLERKANFKFYEPCTNLSQVVDRFNSSEFFIDNEKTNDFEKSEIITLR